MVLDLTELLNLSVETLDIDKSFEIPKILFEKSDIQSLNNTRVKGSLARSNADIMTLALTVSGVMVLEDAISLELIDYPFSFDFEEQIEKKDGNLANSLDITDILWQNIMLEVPLKLTRVNSDSFNEYQGDGWKLVSEDSMNHTNNPFQELKDILREE